MTGPGSGGPEARGAPPRATSSRVGAAFLWLCRADVPVLSKAVRVFLGSDVYCRLPATTQFPHPYGIVIHHSAVLGERVVVFQQVTVGLAEPADERAAVIEDDVTLGAGARVLGPVRVGRGAVVGANAVVTRDVPAGATVVGANRILPA